MASDSSYRVYPEPVESPNHTDPLPPSDARILVINPADATASPLGWHDTGSTIYTITRGNNVHAYEDRDGNNVPPASEVDCGAGPSCDFPIALAQDPSNYVPAAVANLFYWNNIIHDTQYWYGFDAPSGNFQVDNFGLGGAGGDDVRAEAQDNDLGGSNCNANFMTPSDGSRPRMQMFTCANATPERDGDLDNAIILHEYGHGISNRLVGGPSNVSCLGNAQQPGEGLSDGWALLYTTEVGDQGIDSRGMGTFLFGQAPDGPGIRPQPYSTDPLINDYTYETIGSGVSVPHGVGSVWAQGYWEVYWALFDAHGFSASLKPPPNFLDPVAWKANHRALLYINEGLKNSACSPTFLDVRDGIIQAATDNFGAADVCLLWEAFAAFGLGVDATAVGSNSLSVTNGFDVPPECLCEPGQTPPVADAGLDQIICQGDTVQIGTPQLAGHSYSWSPEGGNVAQPDVSPTQTTTYTVTATTDCASKQDSVTVFVNDGTSGISEDFEGGTSGWTAAGLWHPVNDSSCASPGYSSPTNGFYWGQDSTCNYLTGAASEGDLTSPLIFGIDGSSTLSFDYFRVVESYPGTYDKTEVHILTEGGTTSTTVFALDSSDPSTAAWVNSGSISLAAFAGQVIQIRFIFNTVDHISNGFTGWFIDDVAVTGTSSCGPGSAPGLPTNATAGDTEATVTWSAPASDGGSPITSYTVTSSPGGLTSTTADGTTLTATVTGLTNSTSYTFTVVATNAMGDSVPSAASNAVTPAAVAPGSPTNANATAGDTEATVTWSAPASDGGSPITSYTVTSSPGGLTSTTADGTTLTATVTGLTNSTSYTFTVVATNAVGDSVPSAASNAVTPVAVPRSPTNANATAGDTEATVTWSGRRRMAAARSPATR